MATRTHHFISKPDTGALPLSQEWRVRRRFARRLRLLGIPEDLTGWSVLDIGAWHGYFSFRPGHGDRHCPQDPAGPPWRLDLQAHHPTLFAGIGKTAPGLDFRRCRLGHCQALQQDQ